MQAVGVVLQERLRKIASITLVSNTRDEMTHDCQLCQDRGLILLDDGTARICVCQEQKRLERQFQASQITAAFKAKSFEGFDVQGRPPAIRGMLESAKDYADQFETVSTTKNNWLVLLGEPGCGKTHLSMSVANALMKQGRNVLYFQHVEGMSELMDSLRKDSEARINAKMSEMKKAELLLWDDLFKPTGGGRSEPPKQFEIRVAFEVLNYRYMNLLPTVISSERTRMDLISIDRAVGSRIMERGKGHMAEVSGIEANYRLNGV